MENTQQQWVLVGIALVTVFAVFIALCSGNQRQPVAAPVDFQGSNRIPVHSVTDMRRVDDENFRLVRLKDGHDFWLFHKSGKGGYNVQLRVAENHASKIVQETM